MGCRTAQAALRAACPARLALNMTLQGEDIW
jgi:hypothetical protein